MNFAKRLELVRHLSVGCEECWSAVSELGPWSGTISSDPVVESLCHLSTPRSFAMCGADHSTAIAEARQRPIGFAFLLVEEGYALARSVEAPQVLENDVLEIIGRLQPNGHSADIEDLYAKAQACLCQVSTLCGWLDRASAASDMAESYRENGTGDERVHARVLEARALLAAAECNPREAEALLTGALERLGSNGSHAFRRFELLGRLTEVAIGSGEVRQIPAILEQANDALLIAKESVDPRTRVWAIFHGANLTATLAVRLKGQVDLGYAARWAAEELEAADGLFEEFTNDITRLLRGLCLSQLYTFFDPKRAGLLHLEPEQVLDLLDSDEVDADEEVERSRGKERSVVN